ncbi:MAG: RNA polymerase subunit sigma-70 [Solirubrobacterales bacterium]|nr:RNA polymerase subunit sigma-70 [Solirubrobacterales bacterium]
MSQGTLDRARKGDPQAFDALTAPYARELQLHCYRMLGSLSDAEDMLQETLIAAWRGLDGFAGRASLRAWLYRIATNRCLNLRRDSGRRSPPEPVPPFEVPEPTCRDEVTWLQPCPDTLLEQVADRGPGLEARYQAREATELAFIAALQRLPPRQTATLLLRDVLGYSGAEVAAMLETSPTAVKGALQRARGSLDQQLVEAKGVGAAPTPGSAQERALARRFADAFTADDVERVIALLTDESWLAMPPAPHAYRGPVAIAAFLRASAGWRRARGLRLRLVPTRANHQPAFCCSLVAVDGVEQPAGLLVLTLRGERVSAITRFLDDGVSRRFASESTRP